MSTHPSQWEQRSSTDYEKDTYYGDTLRIRQNRTGGWQAYRNDNGLGDSDALVIFETAYEAQRLADLHVSDGYFGLPSPADGLSWRGATAPRRYRIEEELAETVAAAVYAIVRAPVYPHGGGARTDAYEGANKALARLFAILNVSRIGSFDSDSCCCEPYFLAPDTRASLRISFDEAAEYYGMIGLRQRLGSDTPEPVLRKLVSWPLLSLGYTCDYLLKAA